METIGNRLRTARESQGLSIEDAAHRTRIQPIYIRGLENDDYSNFPSTTYAKSFLTLYSRFLEVDAGDALEMFAGGDAISLSGQGYLEAVTDNIEPRRPNSPYATRTSRASSTRKSQAASPGLAPLFLGVILLALVIAIPTFWILGKDSDSMDEVVSKAEDLTNTNFINSDPQAEKAEPEPAEATPEPASPAVTPASEPEPVRIPLAPDETRVAQVIPSSSGERNLETAPGGAAPVATGKKAQETKARPLRAVPAVETPPKPESAAPVPASSSPAGPLRAVPLIARPVIDPEEIEAEEAADPAAAEAEGIADLRVNGNRYPRPSNE